MATTFCDNLTRLMGELGFDDLEVARRIAGRPWLDEEMTAERERAFLKSVPKLQRTVKRWREGRNEPRATQAKLLAAALGVSVDQLLEGGPSE